VAVKVLKPELAALVGTERFLAEIRTTANLSHPHILPLHDSGEADGFLFYVMPYVEGDSLRERMNRDGQLPVEEAVRIAGHVADALDYAHQQGVIHRDIKPGNILFQAGDPVVTDFGIALAISAAGEGRLTETGLSLGTPYYMSPEQAAGDQTPTAASDVYSLGCVLYEMLTGEPPHTGASAQAILGKILLADVTRPTKLRRTIPANVEAAVLKALERLPADRFETASELTAALKDKAFRHGVGVGSVGGPWKGLAISLSLVVLLGMVVVAIAVLSPRTPPQTVRWQIHPPGDGVVQQWARYFAIAPDGSSMVYRDTVGLESGWQLWVKDRSAAEGRLLSGTNMARDVVFSPDGGWIAYAVGTNLIKRPIQGEGTVKLLGGMDPAWVGLSWLADGTILCEQGARNLVRISDDGGGPPDSIFYFSEGGIRWVHGLPHEKGALVLGSDGLLWVTDLQADTAWAILGEVARAWYAPTGHLVFVRADGAVLAAPFDLQSLELGTERVPLFEGVSTGSGWADMELSQDGTAVFVKGPAFGDRSEVVWVDREGREESMGAHLAGDLVAPALSPDGTLLAVEEGGEVWIAQTNRGSKQKLTFEGGHRPAWSPNGGSVTFCSSRAGNAEALWIKRADGSGEAELLVDYERGLADGFLSPDSTWLITRTDAVEDGRGDILAWQIGGEAEPLPLAGTQYREVAPALSPNGRFLAYSSNELGRDQVVVVPFPDVGGGRWLVSAGDGIEPVWSRDGRELFYRRGVAGDLVAVEVETASLFQRGGEQVLFPAGKYNAEPTHAQYDVAPDGQHFVMLRPLSAVASHQELRMIQVLNWFTELEERLGGGR
jgi:serine/threonine-protein kinase